MNSPHYRRSNCRLCKSTDLEMVLPLAPTPVGDAYVTQDRLREEQAVYPLELFLCKDCGLAQLSDVVNPAILYGHFIYETSISLGLVEHFRQYADEVVQRIQPPSGSLVIDIGSNDGTVLGFFRERGMRVLGVEPAAAIAQKACDRGVETLAGFFSSDLARKLRNDYGPAKIVTSNNTFANIDDLDDIMEGIRALLAPDGVFVMETGYATDLVANRLFDTIYHEHLSYFAVRPLKIFFERHDLELVDAQHIGTKGGSFRVTAQLSGGPCPVLPSVESMIQREEAAGIGRPEAYTTLATDMSQVRDRIIEQVKELKTKGKTVAGYGASVGTTTFLYYLGLKDAFDFIADDNPAKFNMFSPGMHIPVLPSQALLEKRPDYVLILAWRYADAIIKNNQAFLERGGRFIVPWPEIKII